MGMTLLLIAMDIIKFQTSEKLYVIVYFNPKTKLCLIYFFCCFFSFECNVYILLFNKCINENIVVLNNEIMSFKMGSKEPLSLKTNP